MVRLRKIAAVSVSVVMLVQSLTVSAKYYNVGEWQSVDQSLFVYEGVDSQRICELAEIGAELVNQNGKSGEIFKILTESGELLTQASDAVAVAHLAADRNYNERTRADYAESTENYVTGLKYFNRLVKSIGESSYKSILNAVFGEEYAEQYLNSMPDEGVAELSNREYELLDSYTEYFDDRDKSAEIFVELVKVRNEIAKKYGYDNYAQYATNAVYGRECTAEEISEFSDDVAEYISPVYRNLDSAMSKVTVADAPMSESEMLDRVETTMASINTELGECFSYMRRNGLYDVSYSNAKSSANGTYTIEIPSVGVPFVFLYPEMSYDKNAAPMTENLIHEFGHFAAMLNSDTDDDGYIGSNEVAELQSQGLELLSERYYGKMFGSAAMFERYFVAWGILSGIVDGCFLNEWETRVYAMDEPTVDKINAVAAEVGRKYYDIEYHPDDAEELWIRYPHSFTSPMYYLSYSLSGMAALGLYALSQDDYPRAVDIYMNVSANGAYVNFRDLSVLYGVGDVFADGTAERTARAVENMYGLAYDDVHSEAWYTPYIYSVSNIADCGDGNRFMPDTAITRSEFVGMIGRMYDYYVGIDGTYSTDFTDVTADDGNGTYVAWANAVGIVTGYDERTFGGDDPLTREQAAVIIYNLAPKENVSGRTADFTDWDTVSEWARDAVCDMQYERIIDGRDNGEFDPKSHITRAETAKIICGYIESEY